MMGSTSSARISLAVSAIERPTWQAGAIYVENMFHALSALDAPHRPETVLLVSTATSESSVRLSALADRCVRVSAADTASSRWQWLQRHARSTLGIEESRSVLLRNLGVDVFFAATTVERGFRVPLVGWIPDFQHHRLPEMFTSPQIRARDEHLARVTRYASRIVLSSRDALQDMERWYPEAAAKARVVPFVAQIPPETYSQGPVTVSDYYGLSRRFLYLPNQFWKHKNHMLVLDALSRLGGRDASVTVVCSGGVHDPRHPAYMAELLARVSAAHLRERFIVLGIIPRHHVLQLMRQSLAVLQPSLFEGWSTTVEEAKSLGKPILLSDIPVHREQNPPGATYFDPHDAGALARCLAEATADRAPGPDATMEETASANLASRTERFAKQFVGVVTEAVVDAV